MTYNHGRSGLASLDVGDRRAITAENPTGARGAGARATEGTGAAAARDLGVGWKVSPSITLGAGQTVSLAHVEGQGVIEHIWLTTRPDALRSLVLRMAWDGAPGPPAVAVPLGDFFCQGWAEFAGLSSELIVAAPHGGLNCWMPMPFRTQADITVENLGTTDLSFYYQIDYTLGEVPADAGYLHAVWHRSNPVPPGAFHTIVDHAPGKGKYIGTYLAVGVNGHGWWGEGEVKMFRDGEADPTICGTGTEDYFGGAWNFDVPGQGYTSFCSNYLGLHQVSPPDGLYRAQPRFGMYRWHVPDPIGFDEGLQVTIQDLGWRSDGRYLPRSDDLASVAYWYSDRRDGEGADIGDALIFDVLDVRSRP